MKIVPAWITEQTESGTLAVLGSEPRSDAIETFIPAADIEKVVVVAESPVVAGRKFGVIVLKETSQ